MNTTREIHNGMDIIDGRDVIARIAELEDERQLAAEHNTSENLWTAADGTTFPDDGDWDEDKEDELKHLKAFENEGSAEWRHGETLIRESYFETYAQELASDLGLMEHCDKWPATCIDWERAASELQMDYSSAEFDGVTYYYRS